VSVDSAAATAVAKRGSGAPEKGTRPRNRKEMILVAAAELFYEHGYSRVSMSEIAQTVGIGPSALYRHYPSKQALLVAVIEQTNAAAGAVVKRAQGEPGAESLESWARLFAAMALDSRSFGVLWQRESRHLPEDDRQRLMESIRDYRRAVAQVVTRLHPGDEDWVAMAANAGLSVLLSVSYHHVLLPRPEFEQLMADMLLEVLATEPATAQAEGATPEGPPAAAHGATAGVVGPVVADAPGSWRELQGTRERLLGAAVELFALHGYAEVGMEDIADAIGIAGPSIYHHFPAKSDILMTALKRGAQALRESAQLPGADGAAALGAVVEAYVKVVAASPAYVAILITELDHLGEAERIEIRAEQRAFVARWVELVQELNPGMDGRQVRIRVHAAITVINDHVRSSRGPMTLRTYAELTRVVAAVLHLLRS